MTKKTMSFVKGMGTGMAVGMMASAAGAMMMSGNKKALKKKASKAVKAVGSIVDDVQSMMR